MSTPGGVQGTVLTGTPITVAVISPGMVGGQVAHEARRAVGVVANVERLRSLDELLALVEGSEANIKITTPLDLKLAEILVKEK